MNDWVEGWLTIKAKTGRLHDCLLSKNVDEAIDLCLQIAAEARLTAKQIQLQKEQDSMK